METIRNWQKDCGCAGLGGATLRPCETHSGPLTVDEGQRQRQRVLGRNVERMMNARRMTYRGAMSAFGLRSTSAVANILNGSVDTRTSTLWAIADFFGVSISSLYEEA